MKKSILAIFVCILSIFLCGCANAPTYSLSQNTDGTVTQMFYIPFVDSELTELGVEADTVTDLKNSVMQTFNTYFINLQQNFVTRVNSDETLTQQDKLLLIAGCPTGTILPALSEIGIIYTLNFSSALHYYYFNSDMQYTELIAALNEDTSVVEEGFFTNRVVSSGSTIYGEDYSFTGTQTLAEYITSFATQILEEAGLSSEQIASVVPTNFVYSYGTTSSKLHSDADRVYHYVNGVYYHEWDITTENSDRQISTWTIQVNTNVWYIVILCSGFVLLGVLFLVDYLRKRKHTEQ